MVLGVKPKRAFELARRHKAFDVKKGARPYLADLDAFAKYADRRARHLLAPNARTSAEREAFRFQPGGVCVIG